MSEPVVSDSLPVLMGKVLAALPAIDKGKTAPSNMGGYAFRGIEQITAAVKPLFGQHGVFVLPVVVERVDSQRSVGQNKVMHCVDLTIDFVFHGPLGDTLTARCVGCGTDMGDKAPQKAVTAAWKSMLTVAFCIADEGMDSEAHSVPETQTGSDPGSSQAVKDAHAQDQG